jgi:O-acetylhomoserine/O-acetylserine sulfhydrylase-like pyridoxal-dependent enzyme
VGGKQKHSLETLATQAGVGADRAFNSISAPIHTTAIYRCEKFGRHRGSGYSRSENPTRQASEEAIADLEGGKRAVAFSQALRKAGRIR